MVIFYRPQHTRYSTYECEATFNILTNQQYLYSIHCKYNQHTHNINYYDLWT